MRPFDQTRIRRTSTSIGDIVIERVIRSDFDIAVPERKLDNRKTYESKIFNVIYNNKSTCKLFDDDNSITSSTSNFNNWVNTGSNNDLKERKKSKRKELMLLDIVDEIKRNREASLIKSNNSSSLNREKNETLNGLSLNEYMNCETTKSNHLFNINSSFKFSSFEDSISLENTRNQFWNRSMASITQIKTLSRLLERVPLADLLVENEDGPGKGVIEPYRSDREDDLLKKILKGIASKIVNAVMKEIRDRRQYE